MKERPGLEGKGYLSLGEIRLEYRMIGPPPGEAPTLVLLHEGLGSVSLWRDFPELLATRTGLGVFVYSREGYGRSSPCRLPRPLDYMQREGEEVVPRILEAIGFERGLLFGHSDGASIAAVYAGATKDSRLAGVIMMAPHFFTEDMGLAAIAEAKTTYETSDLREKLARHHGENVDCAFWGWNRAWLDPEFRKWDIRGYLPRITVPVLVMQGAEDQYGTLAQIDTLESLCRAPVTRCVLENCRHSPHREQQEQTLAAVTSFVGKALAVGSPASAQRSSASAE